MHKSLSCKSQYCEINFMDENHLNINEKHEMILNLGLENKTTVFVDQTPTPTRLIKNCEEVGLFDDLKHVNPFDETFRRAVESSKQTETSSSNDEAFTNRQTSDCLITNEESLHTPQVFPSLESSTELCQQQKEQSITTSTKNINEDGAKKSAAEEKSCEKLVNLKKRKSLNENQCESNKNRKISSRKKSLHNSNNNQQKSKVENRITTKSIVLPSTISIIQPQIITFELPEAASLPSKPILLPKTVELTTTVLNNHSSSIHLQQSQSISVKEKLRDTINNHQNSTSPNIYKKTTLLSENKYFPRKNNNKKIINSIENTNINDESNNAQNDCDDLLERRRAAAMRYRRKIKKEQEELRQKNADLMTENIKLKATIRQLKQILANHQNCSNVQSSCAIGPENITNELSSSQNILMKSVIQIPTVKCMVNIPRIIQQQPMIIDSSNFIKQS